LVDEYSVHVFAFDADGRLLTESNVASYVDSQDRVFKLTGATRLGREQQYVGFAGPPEVISAEHETNDLRLELASKLLDQKRFDDARRVLEEVTKDAPRGRVTALRGRLAALQGDCVTAIPLFHKAESEGGCVASEDRKLCEATRN
jgi:thioredoxin-like negative regulator of GroEL